MKLKDFVIFNPTEKLSKNIVYRKISMDQLTPFTRQVTSNNFEPYKGGTKFRNGDTIFARITPCLENGKTSYVSSLEDNEVASGSTEFIIVRAKEGISLPLFVYYLMTTNRIRNKAIISMTGSSGRERVQQVALDNIDIPNYSINQQQHIVNTIGSIDDLIEKNEQFLSKFQSYLVQSYRKYSLECDNTIEIKALIDRTGESIKDSQWKESKVLDLSTMPNGNIFINDFSDGKNFSTNIKSVNNLDIVYGSIRPYFKKAGFALDVNYIAGTVFSFNVKNANDYLWVLACISSDNFHSFTSINAQGTKMPIINWKTFISYKIRYDSQIVITFQKIIKPIFEICIIKMRQNIKLKEVKEYLLKKYF